ncbi:MAG: Fic family protein [Methyloligellaceae bacterium]
MKWNWKQPHWPDFQWDRSKLENIEAQFLHTSGVLDGALKHFDTQDREQVTIDLMSTEALKTSEIEGEILNRDSVQSSIRRNFGLQDSRTGIPPAEAGIAEMMVDLFKTFNEPLKHSTLFRWHEMLMNGRRDLDKVGVYRSHTEPMQIVSGYNNNLTVHFEAPPSDTLQSEMDRFISWFNKTGPNSENCLPALTRAAIAHVFFVSIHPFEDGNGRIGRAISEKCLSQTIGAPTLVALSMTIQNARQDYYKALEENNKGLNITDWLIYFSRTVLVAQSYSQNYVDLIIFKTKLFDRLRGQLNERQRLFLSSLFDEGPDCIAREIYADKYIRITSASRATATRDLQGLVEKDVLMRAGERKATRYFLNLPFKMQ